MSKDLIPNASKDFILNKSPKNNNKNNNKENFANSGTTRLRLLAVKKINLQGKIERALRVTRLLDRVLRLSHNFIQLRAS